MPKVCIYRPNRSQRRPFRPSDLKRLISYVSRDGATEDEIRAALNAAPPFQYDNQARQILQALSEEDRQAIDRLITELNAFGELLDDLFGNTDWNVPGFVRRTLRSIPIIGRRFGRILDAASAIQRGIQGLKDVIERAEVLAIAVTALIKLSQSEEV